MLFVVVEVVAVEKDVVEIGSAKDVEVFFEAVGYKVLERSWGVGEAKRHDGVFQMSVTCAKRGFPFFSYCHSGLVVSLSDV